MRALYAFRGQSLQFLLDCLLLLDSSTQTFDVGQLEEHAHLALQPVWIYGFAKVCIRARAKRSIAVLDAYGGGAEYDRTVWIELANFATQLRPRKVRQPHFQHVGIEAAAVDLAQRRICIAGEHGLISPKQRLEQLLSLAVRIYA
ncbi:MAG: hypothetical protein QOK44_2791 [Betaproteobacteria bacterium]|nr:hypothetical protein [Betaproteobacteria bacterium]